MATDNTKDNASISRVHKASEVHKRRVERKPSVRRSQPAQTQPQESLERNAATVEDAFAADAEAVFEGGGRTSDDFESGEKARWEIGGEGFQADVPDTDEQSLASDLPKSPLREESSPSAQDAMRAPSTADAREKAIAAGEAASDKEISIPSVGDEADADDENAENAVSPTTPEADGAQDDAAPGWDEPAPPAKKGGLARRIAFVIVAVLVLAIVGTMSYFAWDRWGRYDDYADMQGEWYVEGTAAPITIDAKFMHLAEDVAYSYEIDDHEKTIRFSFGSWEGQGRYRFSEDRTKLALMDGEYDGAGNTADDFVQTMTDLVASVSGDEVALPEGEGVVVLDRRANLVDLVVRRAAEAKKDSQEQEESEYYDDEYYDYYYE